MFSIKDMDSSQSLNMYVRGIKTSIIMDSMAKYNIVYRNMEYSKKNTLLRNELVLIWQSKCLHMVFNVVKILTFFSIVCPSYRMPSVAIGLALLHLILRFTSYNTNITLNILGGKTCPNHLQEYGELYKN